MRYSIYLALILSTSLNAGTIHKWVDEEGNVHYGDTPPVSTSSETVRVQSAPSNPGKALPRLSTQGDADSTSATSGADSAADSSGVPADQSELACQQAKKDLKVINSSNRIKLQAADGTSRYMTTEEIDERKLQSQSDIDKFCN